MGCGQSKIHLYPRKSKSKTNGKKSGNGECPYLLFAIPTIKLFSLSHRLTVDLVDGDAEEDDEGHKEAGEKELNGNAKSQQYHLRNEDDDHSGLLGETDGKGGDDSGLNGEITISMHRGKNLSLLSNQYV